MELKLVVLGGKNAGRVIPISGKKFFIGRAEDCHLRPHSELVSRHHCAILAEEDTVLVRDFGSKNGTFVNGDKVRGEQDLKNGDRLKVGDLEFEVQLTVSLTAKMKPKVHSVEEVAARTAASPPADHVLDPEPDLAGLVGDDTNNFIADAETKTVQYQRSPLAPKEPEPEPEEPAAVQKAEKKEPPKRPVRPEPRKPTGLPKKPNDASASTRDAAASLLKNFFRGI